MACANNYSMNAVNKSANSTWPLECLQAFQFAKDAQANVLRVLQIFLAIAFVFLLVRLFREYKRTPVTFHGNFLLLFINVVFVYLIYACTCFLQEFRYLLLNFIIPLDQPCQMMIPIWWSALVRGPQYFEFFFMPFIHFTIMLERVRATLFARAYEREGLRFALFSLLAIWISSLLFALFILLTMLMDNCWDLYLPLSFTSLVSSSNSCLVVIVLYVIMAIIVVTILADWRVFVRNRRAQKQMANTVDSYSLSHAYQINENIVTMRLILPLDFCYGSLFLVYFSVALSLRSIPTISKVDFQIGYDWINTVMLLHGLITLFFCTKFIRNARNRRKKALKIRPVEQEKDAYFHQLREQWGRK